jgi:hypothetical protein
VLYVTFGNYHLAFFSAAASTVLAAALALQVRRPRSEPALAAA